MEQKGPIIATVSQVNAHVKKVLDHNTALNDLWVKGEISNFKLHYSGHIYLTLKDETGVLKSVMFRGDAGKLTFRPADGMKVLARGRVSVYEAGGSYQLYINEMRPDGLGELYIAYEKLKKSLDEEGLFAREHKKPIPLFPSAIGVVTASTGAAVRDIINVITRRCPMSEIILYPTQVQGAAAAPAIVKAIEYFNKTKTVDTLIVGRGGGSIEDLWAFNEEIVARAVYNSEIPIISAVGHETDYTIIDFVSDLRAPTPSAAAEIAVPSMTELRSRISADYARASQAITGFMEKRRIRLSTIRMKSPSEKIKEQIQRLDDISKHMEQDYMLSISERRKKLGILAGKTDALSPLKVLSRGYAIPSDENKKVIRSVKDMKSGMKFTLRMTDGEKDCNVV